MKAPKTTAIPASPALEGATTRRLFWPAVAFMSLLLFFALGDIFITGRASAMHDTLKTYPFFHFFIQNLQNGTFPLWSPTTHCGEPFWPYIQLAGLANPAATLVAVAAWALRIADISLLFHLYLLVSILVFNVGTALLVRFVLRSVDGEPYVTVMLPIIFLGTMSCAGWAQAFGSLVIATWFPLALFLGLRLLEKTGTTTLWRLKGALPAWALVLSFQLTSGNPAFFCFASGSFFLFYLLYGACRDGLRARVLMRKLTALAVAAALAALFSAPAWMLAKDQDRFFPVGRYASAGKFNNHASYSAGFGTDRRHFTHDIGTPARMGDLFASLHFLKPMPTSELPLLFGVAGFLFFVVGLGCVSSRWQWLFGCYFLFIFWLSLGARAGLSLLFYNHFPGFVLIRHLEFFSPYAFVAGTVIASIGCHRLLTFFVKPGGSVHSRRVFIGCAFLLSLAAALYGFEANVRHHLRAKPGFMRATHPYLGNLYRPRREVRIAPFREHHMYRDESRSFGEPLILYRDSVLFFDNASQLVMPMGLWNFLQSDTIGKLELLGVSRDKLTLEGAESQAIHVRRYGANHLIADVDLERPGELFYSQNAMPGWHASVNGKRIDPAPTAAHPFIELPLPPGPSRVELRYLPLEVAGAYLLHYCGQFLAVGIWLFGGVRKVLRRRRGHQG